MELEGKIAIVTGAAGQIGSVCAVEMARQGAKVIVTDLPGTRVEAVVSEILGNGGQAVGHAGDISAEKDVIALVDTAQRSFGGVDVLVNIAALIRNLEWGRDLDVMTVEDWDEVMAVNVRGAMLGCKYAIPLMLERGSGSIINFGSTASILGDRGLIAYSTSKAALLGLTRSIATTYGKRGIRCNTLCPGATHDEAHKSAMQSEWWDLVERTRLTPRIGKPDDIANMVVFLASEKASYITGQTFLVDGGGTAHQPWVNVE
jgi:NAD(P)-dependent dehydrogenase (short-subunit alcohol dehydrogenase family)